MLKLVEPPIEIKKYQVIGPSDGRAIMTVTKNIDKTVHIFYCAELTINDRELNLDYAGRSILSFSDTSEEDSVIKLSDKLKELLINSYKYNNGRIK